MKVLYFLMCSFIITQLYAMEECLQLSSIEKQLILREIEKQGKDKILAEIRTEGREHTPLIYDAERDSYWFRQCTNFKIDKKFYQKDVDKDLLTKQVFDIIQLFEKEKGRRPEASWEAESDVLGERTQYWWLKDAEDNFLPAIQVQFRPHYYSGDQKAVENVVNTCNQ